MVTPLAGRTRDDDPYVSLVAVEKYILLGVNFSSPQVSAINNLDFQLAAEKLRDPPFLPPLPPPLPRYPGQ